MSMKKILKTLFINCPFITRPLYGGIGYILMLHRVCLPGLGPRVQGNALHEITPRKLEALIRFFKDRDYFGRAID